MNITYDGIKRDSAQGLITFTDIPNILSIKDDAGGTTAMLSLTFKGNLKSQTSSDGQWYITIFGETITNVIDYNNAVNKNFYVSTAATSTAASVARALRNCPSVYAAFTVKQNGVGVWLTARSVGALWTSFSSFYKTNITSTYLSSSAVDGSANSDLNGALINVDVNANGKYVTTLSKNFYGGECAFNMSPVLTTVAQMGVTVPYTFVMSYIKKGEYTSLGGVNGNYVTPGYMVNQGAKYIDLASSSIIVAQNYKRGNSRDASNNTILYLYGNSIPLSFYKNVNGQVGIDIRYINSAGSDIAPGTAEDYNFTVDGSSKLKDATIPLTQSKLNLSTYIDIWFEATSEKIRYNVIKPLKATEYYQRIIWRNSYGGLSFFDFTGQKSETRDVTVETYQKNLFGYYEGGKNELDMVYDNDVKYTVTLKSHLFEHDGKYIFNDLAQSAEVWTVRNGETYAIIVESVSVEEQDRNDIYECVVKYRYSQHPSLI